MTLPQSYVIVAATNEAIISHCASRIVYLPVFFSPSVWFPGTLGQSGNASPASAPFDSNNSEGSPRLHYRLIQYFGTNGRGYCRQHKRLLSIYDPNGRPHVLFAAVDPFTADIHKAPNNILKHKNFHNQGPEKDASSIYHYSRRPPPTPLPNHLCCCDATIETGSTRYGTSLQIRGTHYCGGQGA